jgi:predicted protein tyrosine phosphatase
VDVRASSLARVRQDCEEFEPTHVLSMMDPGIARHRIPVFPAPVTLLQVFFYDDDDLHLQCEPLDVPLRKIFTFLREFAASPEPEKRLLVHCHRGASRSPASIFILYAIELRKGNEKEAFEALLARTVKPWPNRYMIAHADRALNRDGNLLQVLDAYRDRFPRRYEAYLRLNRSRSEEPSNVPV